MTMDVHSHAGWYRAVVAKSEAEQLTITESMLLCLHNIQNHLYELKQTSVRAADAAEHTEGMVGAIDGLAEQIAANAGLPYASSGKVREALDAQRDADRALAAEQRRKAISSQGDAA